MKIALANNPYDPELLLWGTWFYIMTGKFEVVYPMINLAMKVDPINPWHYMSMGGADYFSGQFISAVENCSKAYNMQPENPMTTFWYAISLAYVKRYKEAIAIVEKHLKNPDRDNMTQQAHFLKLILTRDMEGISQLSSEDFFSKCKKDLQHSYHNASFYAFLDQKESAFEWLENAVNRGFINYPFMNEIDPFLENIRGEPRFKKLMQRVKKEWESFEV